MHKVFVSYVYEDRSYRDQVMDWAAGRQLGEVQIVFETEDVRQRGEAGIKEHLRPIMRGADAALVLVGQDTHNRRWVDAEVHYCASSGKPIVWAQLPNTTGAPPPELRGNKPVPFAPGDLRMALEGALARRRT